MPGEWKILKRKDWKSGHTYFQAYRLLDKRKPDMDSNREYMGFMFSTEENANRAVRYLNRDNKEDGSGYGKSTDSLM